MARTSRRGPWLPEEDSALIDLVRTQGPNNWVRISQQLQHRSPKQCRERYHQNLKPSLNHDPISPTEGERIEQLVEEMGKRWAEIARRLGNRSDNAVKNWWNGSINRRKRSPSSQNSMRHSGNRLHSAPTTVPQLPPFEFGDRALPNGPVSAPIHHYQFQNPWSSQRDTSPTHATPAPSSFDHYARRATVLAPPSTHEAYKHGEQQRYSESFSYEGHREHGEARSRLPPLRLPPISSSRVDSVCITGPEKPSVSPALSEFSHAYSTRPVPSLVSDNQSSCSVSPKTLTSPRTRATPYSESRDHRWSYPDRPQSGSYQGIKGQMPLSPLQIETLVMPPILNTLGSNPSTYQPMRYHDGVRTPPYEQATTTTRTGPLRDSRMHVSSLVQ